MFSPHIIYLPTAESTNSEMSRLITSGSPDEWTVIAARSQTQGRGQAGNKWESAPGKNICCSICLFPQGIAPAEQFIISMAVAVGITDFLIEKGLPAQIKWPNDIYINDKKICGILIENQLMGGNICSSIIGIGLNVNQEQFSDNIPNPTSLVIETGLEFDTDSLLVEMVAKIRESVRIIYTRSFDTILAIYHERLYLRDMEHRFYKGSVPINGIIKRVAITGALTLLETESQSELSFFFKEISYSCNR